MFESENNAFWQLIENNFSGLSKSPLATAHCYVDAVKAPWSEHHCLNDLTGFNGPGLLLKMKTAGPAMEEFEMKYMLMFASPDNAAPADQEAWGAYIGAIMQSGIAVASHGLKDKSTATTVRIRNGERIVEDGPFADAKESIGGYFVIDVADLDAALDWAAKCPSALEGAVEVRPVAFSPMDG